MQGKRYGRALVSTRAPSDDVRSCGGVDPGERGECHPARRGQVDSIHPDAETKSLLGRSLSFNGFLKELPALKVGTVWAGILIFSPVCGFLPSRAFCSLT